MLSTDMLPRDVLVAAGREGWDLALLERARSLGFEERELRFWVVGAGRTPEEAAGMVARREQMLEGHVRVREATWGDQEALADLFGDSPESIEDLEVTVERSPNAFAQFALAENPSLTVVEDRDTLLAASFRSVRNALVGGRRICVSYSGAARVRRAWRGQNLSRLLQEAPGAWNAPLPVAKYYLLRAGNLDSQRWLDRTRPHIETHQKPLSNGMKGVRVAVTYLTATPVDADAAGMRLVRRSDAPVCVRLINRTHRGADLFRPHTAAFLRDRLDAGSWSPRPAWAPAVYGWRDYRVVERAGRVVACAGLWDRGADIREVWRSRDGAVLRTLDPMVVIDFGCAQGGEVDLVRLLRSFAAEAASRGRSGVLVPLQHLPGVAAHLSDLEQHIETRYLHWSRPDFALHRPFADLVYW